MKLSQFVACTLVLLCGASLSASALGLTQAKAQSSNSGSIAGAVQDSAGAVVAGAIVIVKSGSAVAQIGAADDKGGFLIGGLAPGTYSVTVSAKGFQDFSASVTVTTEQPAEVVATMMPPPAADAPTNTPSAPQAAPQTAPQTPAQAAPQTAPQATPQAPPASSQAPPAAAAQEVPQKPGTGSITGTVQDNSGGVVPGSTVTVKSGAAVIQTGASDEKGAFSISGLAPGTYTVAVSSPGFQDFNAPVTITAGQVARMTAAVMPAGVNTSVNVQGQTVTQVETESSQIGGTITAKEITAIGLNGRNFTQLIALAPGVSNQTGQDEALVGAKGSVKYSVNGGRVEYNTFDVDGGDVLNASINGSSSSLIVFPSLDSISDLQVLTSNFGAMYGRSASGTILATTKSGGNEFHGDGYFFARNDFFNSRNFFDQTKHAPLYKKYDPGGTIGGPLYIPGVYNNDKNKTYFFVSEEYRHEREPVEFNQGVPTLAERNCLNEANPQTPCVDPGVIGLPASQQFGDFSDVCPPLNGNLQAPFSRVPGTSFPYYPDCPGLPLNTYSATALNSFFYNLVPISTVSNQILNPYPGKGVANSSLIPPPNATSGCNSQLVPGSPIGSCYNAAVSPLTTWREDLFRIDHNFTPNIKGYVRFIHDAWSTVVAVPQWAYLENSFPTVENNFVGPGTSIVAHLSNTITTSFVNDLAISYTTDHITLSNIPGPGVSSVQRPTSQTSSNPLATCDKQTDFGSCIGYLFGPSNLGANPPNPYFGNKLPGIMISGTNVAYGGRGFAVDPAYMPWKHSNPTYSPRDDATFAFGKHTFDFGALAIFAQRNEINPPVGANIGDTQGLANFTNLLFSSTGNAFADFLEANIFTFQQDSAQHEYHNNYTIAEPYFQDDWKVKSRLTLNLGIRFSLFGTYHEKNHNAYNFVLSQFNSSLASEVAVNSTFGTLVSSSSGAPVPLDATNLDPHLLNGIVQCGVSRYANGKAVPDSCMSGHLFNPAPRIGFAWDPFGNGKMSVRGGYGIFFEHGTGNEANTGSLEGSPADVSSGGVIDSTEYFQESWGCIGNQGARCSGITAAYPLNVTSIPTKAVWSYAQQWSFSVQRELPWNLLGSMAYVGSKGTHLTTDLQINQLVPLSGSQNPFQTGQPLTQATCSGQGSGEYMVDGQAILAGDPAFVPMEAACNYGLGPAFIQPNSLRTPPNAIANGVGQIFSLQNVANSQYDGLQVTLRRTKGPLTLGTSYTYSHSIDDSSDRTDATLINAYNLRQNRASSNFDERHLLSLDYIYDLPVGRFFDSLRKGWAQVGSAAGTPPETYNSEASQPALLGGWQLSGIVLYASGTPYTVTNGGTVAIGSPDNAGVASGTGAGSYPDIASNPLRAVLPLDSSTIGPLLGNPNRFVAPTGLTFGDAGRNSMNNPSRLNFDMSLLKTLKTTESTSLQLRLEAYNVFNHTQFEVYDPGRQGIPGNNVVTCYGGADNSAGDTACLQGSSFLHPIDAHRPRTIQLGVKFLF